MSWTRMKSDVCAQNKDTSQSTAPVNYTLDPNKFYNCHDCRVDFGLIGGNNVSVTRNNMVDLESDLWGITRPNSTCPERKYIPHCVNCAENSGLPCIGGGCKSAEAMHHLKECQMIAYAPRIDHTGYHVQYPQCPPTQAGQKGPYPPQLNPTRYRL